MAKITVDFSRKNGKIKPMHATGHPPFLGTNFSFFKYMKNANIPYGRLHDLGAYGKKYVDISSIFPNFDADPSLPESYRFDYTDGFLSAMQENGIAPIFRLGETIENGIRAGYKAIFVDPPKDYEKWAKVCEMIIRHYNEGWANGNRFGIKYWEIWNEPENGIYDGSLKERNQMWTGTAEDYYRLYTVTAKHLKSCFGDSIMIGGYGASGLYSMLEEPEKYGLSSLDQQETNAVDRYRLNFFLGFVEYIEKENAPLDFFSFHCYRWFDYQKHFAFQAKGILAEHGYGDAELHLNEWNNSFKKEKKGSSYSSAKAAEFMIMMHDSPVDIMNYYDTRIGTSSYSGMFNPLSYEPFCIYYTFAAYGELYAMGDKVICESDTEKIRAIAASDGINKGVLITNTTGADVEIETNIFADLKVYIIDEKNHMSKKYLDPKCFVLKKDQVAFIRN